MSIEWYGKDGNKIKMIVNIKEYGMMFSKKAYEYVYGKVSVGIDKENNIIGIKQEEDGMFILKPNQRIAAAPLSKWLKTNGVAFGKYECEWNEKEQMLTIKY